MARFLTQMARFLTWFYYFRFYHSFSSPSCYHCAVLKIISLLIKAVFVNLCIVTGFLADFDEINGIIGSFFTRSSSGRKYILLLRLLMCYFSKDKQSGLVVSIDLLDISSVSSLII